VVRVGNQPGAHTKDGERLYLQMRRLAVSNNRKQKVMINTICCFEPQEKAKEK
jgi:hypothetical protein